MTKSLAEQLGEIARFLYTQGVPWWPQKLTQYQDRAEGLAMDDTSGWQRLLRDMQLFGGMGALDDQRCMASHQYQAMLNELFTTLESLRRTYGVI